MSMLWFFSEASLLPICIQAGTFVGNTARSFVTARLPSQCQLECFLELSGRWPIEKVGVAMYPQPERYPVLPDHKKLVQRKAPGLGLYAV